MKASQRLKLFAVLLVAAVFVIVLFRMGSRRLSPGPARIPVGRIITPAQILTTHFGDALLLCPDGTVWGWGDNASGILWPPGWRGSSSRPHQIGVGSNWTQLAVTSSAGYGIKTDGTLWAWTFNPSSGASGVGARGMPRPTAPASQFFPGSNWVSIAAGAGHCLALQQDGTLFAWGQNNSGQVGNGTTTNVASPVRIGASNKWTAIAAGSMSSLALASDGSIWHWGFVNAGYGQGPNTELNRPVRVDSASDWVGVRAGYYCHLGEKEDGSFWVWGANAHVLGSTNRMEPMKLDLNLEGELLWLSTEGVLVRQPDGAWRNWTPSGDRVLLDTGRLPFDKAWSSGGSYFGLGADGTLWTWGVKLGTKRPRPFSGIVNRLLSRLGRRPPLTTGLDPVVVKDPWPIARLVTNNAPLSP